MHCRKRTLRNFREHYTERNRRMNQTEYQQNEIVWQDRKHVMWFPIGFEKYTVKNGRIYINRGLLTTVSDQTLLYRITDIQLRRTLGQKIFGTGTIVLVSKVDADHEIVLRNIKNSEDVANMLSDLIEYTRRNKNVVGKEFYSSGCGLDHDGDYDMDFDDDDNM